MIKIAIVEDETMYIDKLKDYINKYAKENDVIFDVKVFNDGDEITKDYHPIFDIIFLDINMKFMDGMTTAKFIRNLDSHVILIFITNMANYAIKGYEVDAMSYILKPVPYFAFSQELKRSIKRVESKDGNYLIILTNSGMLRLNLRDVVYIESARHRVIIHMNSECHSMVATIKGMEAKLKDKHFFRCNSGYLVNLAQVTGVDGNIALLGEEQLLISRPRKKMFLNALTDYVGGLVK